MNKTISISVMLLLILTAAVPAFAAEQRNNKPEYTSNSTTNFMYGDWRIKYFLGFPNSTKHAPKDIQPYCEKLVGKTIIITSDLFDSESVGINDEFFAACSIKVINVRYMVKDLFSGKDSELNFYRNYKIDSDVTNVAANDEIQVIGVYLENNDFIPDLNLLVVNDNRLLIGLSDGYFELERITPEHNSISELDSDGLADNQVYSFKDSNVTYDGIEYITHGKSITITGYSGYSRGIITIPKELNGLPVTDIGAEAFAAKHHPIGIILPDSIISIGDRAFENMWASFHLRNGVKNIGDYAFRMSGLSRIILPDSVESIGQGAFYDCYGLEQIVIPFGIKEIKANTFKKCPDLTKAIFLNPDTEISLSAFDNPKDIKIVIYGYVGSNVEKFANDNGYIFKPYIPIKINDKEIIPVNAVPEVVGEDIFVPLRFIVEALYHTVDYYEADGQGEISIDGGAFWHTIGTDYMRWMGGDIVEPILPNKSYVENEVTMVNLDFIKQAIKCEIFWNKSKNSVEISAK